MPWSFFEISLDSGEAHYSQNACETTLISKKFTLTHSVHHWGLFVTTWLRLNEVNKDRCREKSYSAGITLSIENRPQVDIIQCETFKLFSKSSFVQILKIWGMFNGSWKNGTFVPLIFLSTTERQGIIPFDYKDVWSRRAGFDTISSGLLLK